MTDNNISLKLNIDQELTPFEHPSNRVLEISLIVPEVDETFQRPRLNLALVVDRSGSMAGEKLEYVKKAASHVVEILEEEDRVALIEYDHDVNVLFPSTTIDDESRPTLISAINSIHTRGSTNLCDGYLIGCQQIAGAVNNDTFTHTLLLSDGRANVGETNPQNLAKYAMELARRGVSTSTFGVGLDFNHHLLEDMANQGDGLFHFIESPLNIPSIFEKVFKDLLTIFAHEVELTVSYPPEVKTSLLGNYHSEFPEAGKLRIYLGSLSAGKEQELFIKLAIPAGQDNTELPIKVSFRGKDHNGALIELTSERLIKSVNHDAAEAAPIDTDLLKRFTLAELGDRSSSALKLEQEGKRQEASELVDEYLKSHRKHLDEGTHQHYQAMSQRMASGMNEADRKRSHFDSYNLKKGMGQIQTFHLLDNVKGHIVFNKDGHLVFVDTGANVSFGRQAEWEFMGKILHLPPGFPKISPDYLSQTIGVPIDFLLGMDVLKDFYFQINNRDMTITFSEMPLPAGNLKIDFEVLHGCLPYASIMMNGALRKVHIDTGAKIHFLRKQALEGLEPIDKEMDFHPFFGDFETDVYEIPVEVAGEKHIMRCGVFTPVLEAYLDKAGSFEGDLGTELYNKYIATFDMQNKALFLERY